MTLISKNCLLGKTPTENPNEKKINPEDLFLRYPDEDLAEFKKIILSKIEQAEDNLKITRSTYVNTSNNGTDDTYRPFKAFEEGSEMLSREQNTALAIRQEKFIRDLKNALVRVENKTYGFCQITKQLISKERLLIVPHTTMCVEAKNCLD